MQPLVRMLAAHRVCSVTRFRQWPERELLAGRNQLQTAAEKRKMQQVARTEHARKEGMQGGDGRWQREQGHEDLHQG